MLIKSKTIKVIEQIWRPNKLGVISFIKRSRRVFKLARYPTRKEMWAISRVCILGIIVIGFVAFIIALLFVNGLIPIIKPSTTVLNSII